MWHLALGMHPSICPSAALHSQSLTAFLPDLAKGLLQNALHGGHRVALTPLELETPATPPHLNLYRHS